MRRSPANCLAGCLAGILALLAAAHASAGSVQEQVALGKSLYDEHCARCHNVNLRGSAHGTTLKGETFLSDWHNKSTAELTGYNIDNMPPGGADLSGDDHLAMVAYLLAANDLTPPEALSLEQPVTIGSWTEAEGAVDSWSSVDNIDEIARSRSAFNNQAITDLQPVTQEILANPPPEAWLSWRRTLDGHGYSPLDQINQENVEDLKLAWVVAMGDGSNQVTPLVHQGVMYLTHPGNVIQALRADTGDLIWEYRYPHPAESMTLGGPTRNIAIYEDKLYLATYDAAITAINAATGEQVWRTVKADYKKGYTHTSGPIIGNGVVLSGINGCERYKHEGCFITGHDAETGEELWRTSTIAEADDPNSASWGSIPQEFRAGSDTWIAGSFDPTLNLFLIGTSQAKPWVAASRGMTTDDAALYTNSTLALDAHSGRLVWYYQHIPGETIDMEVGLERVLVDLADEKLVFTIGKDGILWKLNRETGSYIDHLETLPQNIFSRIDSNTGKVTYRRDIREAGIGDTVSVCPGIYGGHNWQAMAYHPAQESLIIPLHQLCSDMTGRQVEMAVGEGGFGGESRTYEMPGVNGQLGRLSAINVRSMEETWKHEQRAMFMTGALTTGGGLVFIGDLDRYVKALDVTSGDVLWQTRLGAPTHGYIVSYAVKGQQYVAIPTGMGVFRAATAVISPDIYQPANGQALYVFKLPD